MKPGKVYRYIVDVWLPNKTVIAESYYIQEGVDNLLNNVRRDWGADATYNIVSSVIAFTV